MKFTKLVPNIFYADIQVGLKLFIDCLEFSISYNDLESARPSCVAEKDGLAVFLHQDPEFAAKDRPEIRLATDNIQEAFDSVFTRHPELLHPNLKTVKLRPWGAKEFALLDGSGVCVIVQQW